jgi:hypothetical protein
MLEVSFHVFPMIIIFGGERDPNGAFGTAASKVANITHD